MSIFAANREIFARDWRLYAQFCRDQAVLTPLSSCCRYAIAVVRTFNAVFACRRAYKRNSLAFFYEIAANRQNKMAATKQSEASYMMRCDMKRSEDMRSDATRSKRNKEASKASQRKRAQSKRSERSKTKDAKQNPLDEKSSGFTYIRSSQTGMTRRQVRIIPC